MTTVLEGGEWSASRPGSSLPLGKTRYPLYRRLGGPQGRSGRVRKISPPPELDPRTVQPVASRYTNYATRSTLLMYWYIIFFSVVLRPNAGHGLLNVEVSRSHTTTHHNRLDSSGRVISSSQRPLPDNTTLTTDKYPCPQWDSYPRSQQANGRRTTP